jgi:hypothetical protein
MGLKKILPCGHEGECVVGTFWLCPICDAVAKKPQSAGTTTAQRPKCPRCGKTCTEPFNTEKFTDLWHCGETSKWDGEDGCGQVFMWDSKTGEADRIGDPGDFSDEIDTVDLFLDSDDDFTGP